MRKAWRHKRTNRADSCRSSCGAVIVGFGVELAVGTAVVIAFAFFLLDAAMGALYREKLAYVSGQGARFAAACSDKDVQGATKDYVTTLFRQFGLSTDNLQVVTADATVNGKAAVACTTAASFPLLQGSILPPTIELKDISVAIVNPSSPSVVGVQIMGIVNVINLDAPVRVIKTP